MFELSNDSSKNIAALLLETRQISEAQYKSAINVNKESGKNIILFLLENNFTKEKAIAATISKENALPYIKLSKSNVDEKAVALLPKKWILSNQVLPYAVLDDTVRIAIADHSKLKLAANLKLLTTLPVDFTVTTITNLYDMLVQYNIIEKEQTSSSTAKSNKALPPSKKKTRTSWKKSSSIKGTITAKGKEAYGYGLEEEFSKEQTSEVQYFVDDVFIKAIQLGASDIHIERFRDHASVRFRMDGILQTQEDFAEFVHTNYLAVISRVKIMSELDIGERRLPQDGAINFKNPDENIDVDVRVSLLPNINGERIVMRILNKESINIDINQLGFYPKDAESFLSTIKSPQGLILVTGPTGSGKTTTLYAALKSINKPGVNILTAEDPVEYQLPGIGQTQIKEDIGLTFQFALRSFLRQDPDVILVGEIRDEKTAAIAIESALTGHLVLSTVHTNNAVSTIARLVNMKVPNYLISSALRLVIAQRLARKICSKCREPDKKVDQKTLIDSGFSEAEASRVKAYKGKGGSCQNCNGTGYKGRQGIYEVLSISSVLENAILKNLSSGEIFELAKKEGFTTMQQMGRNLIHDGTITLEEFKRTMS